MAIRLHYFRGGWPVSPRLAVDLHMVKRRALGTGMEKPAAWVFALASAALLSASANAQYPGQIKPDQKNQPELRAVAVLEWTGEPGKPKACRIVPVTVFDGEKLQDGGVYLARPQPLALSGEVEYELEQNGKPFGLFDIKNAGQEQGSWVGFGDWKPMPKPKTPPPVMALSDEDSGADDKPVLHRKSIRARRRPGRKPDRARHQDRQPEPRPQIRIGPPCTRRRTIVPPQRHPRAPHRPPTPTGPLCIRSLTTARPRLRQARVPPTPTGRCSRRANQSLQRTWATSTPCPISPIRTAPA